MKGIVYDTSQTGFHAVLKRFIVEKMIASLKKSFPEETKEVIRNQIK